MGCGTAFACLLVWELHWWLVTRRGPCAAWRAAEHARTDLRPLLTLVACRGGVCAVHDAGVVRNLTEDDTHRAVLLAEPGVLESATGVDVRMLLRSAVVYAPNTLPPWTMSATFTSRYVLWPADGSRLYAASPTPWAMIYGPWWGAPISSDTNPPWTSDAKESATSCPRSPAPCVCAAAPAS